MRKRNSDIQLTSYEELLGLTGVVEEDCEKIKMIPLEELHTFKDHPFRVADDEKMQETKESIEKYGVLVPALARVRAAGGYELISGHRRKRACELAGMSEMPVIVRNYSDDEATIIMVDSNIQREDILPSEKARAYFMKYEALKHQGRKEGGSTLETIGEAAGENPKTVQRYIRLVSLTDDLLDMVDSKKLGFIQGVELSYLTEEQQIWVLENISTVSTTITKEQAGSLKNYAKSGELTRAMVQLILWKKKDKDQKITLKRERIAKYFPENYSTKEMEDIIFQLLEDWMNKA